MRKQRVVVSEYIFSPEEAQTIVNALTYVKHRIDKHPTCGAKFVGIDKVEELLKQLQ